MTTPTSSTPTEREPRTTTGRQVVEATASDPFIPDNQKVALRAAALRTVLAIEREAAAVNVEDWIEAARAERLRIDRAAGAATETGGLDAAGLFRVPFDRDGRLLPDDADNWTEEQFDAFYVGLETGIEVVRGRYENPDEWRRSSLKAARLSVHPDREDAPEGGGAES